MDWPPLDFVENGEPLGYSIDMIRLLADKLGLKLEFVNGASWSELLKKGKQREIDLFPVIVNTLERRDFLDFTLPYLSIGEGLYVSETLKNKKSFSDMDGHTIAIVKGHAFATELKKKYPKVKVLEVSYILEGLKSVANGIADGVVTTKAVADYLITAHGIWGLHYHSNAGRALQDTEQELSIGTRNDMPVLNSLMQKALDAVTQEERQILHEKWFVHQQPSSIGLTKEERQWLVEHPVIRVSNEMDWAPFDFMQKGRPAGYSIDMMDHIANILGVRFEYVNGLEWHELLDRFRNPDQEGGIDVMSAIYRTEERKAYALFTPPYYRNPPAIITRNDESDINTLRDLSGRRVALPQSYAISGILQKEVPGVVVVNEIDGEPIQNILTALKAVVSGKADAVVESSALLAYHIEDNALPNLKIAAYPWFRHHDIRDMDLYAAVRNDWPIFHSILGKAMKHIRPEVRQTWVKRWIYLAQLGAPPIIAFTPKEKNWLSSKEEIIYCVDPNWMPYERINKKGEYQGMVADYVALVGKRMGVPFQLHPTASWTQSLDEMKRGSCDIIAATSPTASRREWLDFTQPYLEFPLVIALRSEELFIENFATIQGKTIGAVKDYAHIDLIHSQYPNLNIQAVENVEDGLRRVANNEIFGFVDTVASIGYAIRQEGLDLKIGGRSDIALDLAFAMRKGESPELLSALDKVVASFSESEMNEITNKWFSIRFERGIDYSLLWKVVLGSTITILMVVLWNRKLVRLNKEIARAHEEVERLSITDQLTELPNRRHIDDIIRREMLRFKRYERSFSLVLIDIDNFKSVNDKYGHIVGDNVLMEFAKVLSDDVRQSDIVGRWGGEEFILLCPETGLEQAADLARLIKERVSKHDFPIIGHKTASFGVSSLDEDDTEIDLLRRADNALYQAKEDGGNQVRLG